jgi:hypothetical protein
VSGSLPLGGVQIHASTGADHVYGSGTFLGPTDLPLGQWVPLTLSFDGITQAGFDPGAVVQLGIKLMSGFTGDVFAGPTDPVLQIDSVTD